MKILKKLTLMVIMLSMLVVIMPLTLHASDPPQITAARYAYLYNIENEKLLYSKNADEKIYPASTVKLMTAILAIERLGTDWEKSISVPEAAVKGATGNRISLKKGEIVTIGNLINSIIVGGANDSALTVAYTISGSVEEFVALMNEKAIEIGAKNTFYTNPTGVHDDAMTTTLEDTAKIALYAFNLHSFVESSSLERYVMPPTNLTRVERRIVNRNYFVSNTVVYKYYNREVVGLNAGSTSAAGNCLVAIAVREGISQLVIISGGAGDEETNYAYIEAQKLLDWAFNEFSYINILSSAKMICEVPVNLSGKVDHVTLLPEKGVVRYMQSSINPDTDIDVMWTLFEQSLSAPVAQGQVAGTLTLSHDGELLARVNLVAKNSVDRNEWLFLWHNLRTFMSGRLFKAIAVSLVLFSVFYVLLMSVLSYRKKVRTHRAKAAARARNQHSALSGRRRQ